MNHDSNFLDERILEQFQKEMDVFLSFKRFDSAEKFAKSYIARHGHHATFYRNLALTYNHQSLPAEAIHCLENALLADPDDLESRLCIVAIYCDLGEYEKAREQHSLIQNGRIEAFKRKQIAFGKAKIARNYASSGMIPEAIEELEAALEAKSDIYPDMLLLAKLYLKTDQFDKARFILQKLIQVGFELENCRSLLGLCHVALQRPDEVDDLWRKGFFEKIKIDMKNNQLDPKP
jgi:tetratricopeptide (TPR) repeat protein